MTKLPSERQSTRTERRIRQAARALGYRGDVVFEHGHYWLMLPDGSIFDVVDAEGPNAINGFAFERVS